jgi:C-terminal processing protease CtpA/Prc
MQNQVSYSTITVEFYNLSQRLSCMAKEAKRLSKNRIKNFPKQTAGLKAGDEIIQIGDAFIRF